MTATRKIYPTIAIILALLMSFGYAIPQGLHLEFCFGTDGHFDIALDSCTPQDSRETSHETSFRSTTTSLNTHHGTCLDISSHSPDEIIYTGSAIQIPETPIKYLPTGMPFLPIYSPSFMVSRESHDRLSRRPYNPLIPFSYLHFIRTTVLLI